MQYIVSFFALDAIISLRKRELVWLLCFKYGVSAMLPQYYSLALPMRGSMGGGGAGGLELPEKPQSYRVSQQYWSGSPNDYKAIKPRF